MMMADIKTYRKGELVDVIDLSTFGPIEVPAAPACWYLLRVHPHLQLKVMKRFRQINVSAWLPMYTTTENVTRYRRGYETTVQQQVTNPLVSGVVIIPDFEAASGRYRDVNGVIGLHRIGPCVARLTPQHIADLRNIEAIGNTPKSKRAHKFAVGELTRVAVGPFRSFSARVERLDSPSRLRVGVEIFGRVTPIDIDASDLEKV